MKIQFDGQEIEVKGLNLNQLILVEEKFGSLANMGKDIPLKLVRYIAFLIISPVRTELTEEQIGAKLNMESVTEIAKILMPEAKVSTERPLQQA